MIDLRLFRVPAFRVSLATFTLTTLVVFGFYVFTAQYLQLVLGLSPLSAGLWMLPGSGAVVLGSMLAPAIVRRVHPAFVIGAALGLCALGFGVLTQLGTVGLAGLVTGTSLVYLGLGPVYTLGTDLVVGAAPPERAGAAAALSETSSEFGGALGIAVLGSIGTATYRATMAAANLAGVPPEARRAAEQTLGGAAGVAAHLPQTIGVPLLAAARASFTAAMEQSAAICAVVSAATAIMAVVALRRVHTADDAERPTESSLPCHEATDSGPARFVRLPALDR